jgi:LacI family transcriptional regulator
LNYRRNKVASSLVRKKTDVVGLIIPCVTISYFPDIARSVQDTARSMGYQVLVCYSDDSVQREREEISLLLEHRVSGLIVTPAHERQDVAIFQELQRSKTPFVLIDKYLDGLDCNFVGTDDKKGAYDMVSHLIATGHRRIGCLCGPQKASTVRDRVMGYRQALIDNGITVEDELIAWGGWFEEDGYQATEGFASLSPRPTAIFALTDMLAIGLMRGLSEKGIRVPNEIAVGGFADMRGVDVLHSPLTTVRQPAVEIGKQAVQLLIGGIEKGGGKSRRILLEPTVIIRNSCGCGTKS